MLPRVLQITAAVLAVVLLVESRPVLGQAPAPIPAPTSPVRPPAATAQPTSSVSSRVLGLPEVIRIALETQPQIQSRLYDYAAARYRVAQAFAPLLPQLSASWTASRDRFATSVSGVSVSGIAGTDTATRTTAQLALSQLLFDFGKSLAATEVSRRFADVAKEDIEVQRDLIVLAVKEAYFNLLFANRLIVVNQQALDRADLNLKSARGFYEVGTRPKSDVVRAEVDVANAQLEIIRARNASRLAQVALNTGMGLTPVDAPVQVEDVLAYQPFVHEHGQLLPEALRGRAEYRQARLRVNAAESTVKLQIRNFFPDITANALVGATTTDFQQIWELGVALNWNIFDGGGKIARYQESLEALKSTQAQLRASELGVAQEVEQANLNVDEAEQRIQAAKAAVASAQENFRLSQGRFDAGVGTILELTDAQLALTQAQSTEAQALSDFHIAVARLERALGRR
jgi:outer membrane protein TolC